MTDKNKLRSQMALHALTDGDLADSIGLSRQSMSYKLNGKRDFTVREIDAISRLLDLSLEERDEIFFANTVENEST